jgi:hypothetical protein
LKISPYIKRKGKNGRSKPENLYATQSKCEKGKYQGNAERKNTKASLKKEASRTPQRSKVTKGIHLTDTPYHRMQQKVKRSFFPKKKRYELRSAPRLLKEYT